MSDRDIIDNTLKKLESNIEATNRAAYEAAGDMEVSRYWFQKRDTYRHALAILKNEIFHEKRGANDRP